MKHTMKWGFNNSHAQAWAATEFEAGSPAGGSRCETTAGCVTLGR